MTITKDTIIGDILKIAPQTAPIFMGIGMHCLGCPASQGETVERACMVHGVDVNELLSKVNELIGKYHHDGPPASSGGYYFLQGKAEIFQAKEVRV